MKYYYHLGQEQTAQTEPHAALLAWMQEQGVTPVHDFDEEVSSRIFEASSFQERDWDMVRTAKEAGSRSLVLYDRIVLRTGIPEEFQGYSKINPNGVGYSQLFVAKSAIKVMIDVEKVMAINSEELPLPREFTTE